jgi:hypothetical protein
MEVEMSDLTLAKIKENIVRYGDEGRSVGITDDEKLFQYVVDKLTADGIGPDNEAVARLVVMDLIRKVGESPEALTLANPEVLDWIASDTFPL